MKYFINFIALSAIFWSSCSEQKSESAKALPDTVSVPVDDFSYQTEQFSDIKILRYKVPGFEALASKEKEMLYYLSQASLAGRDIMWDQNYKHNLCVRRTLEAIVNTYKGDKGSEEYKKFLVYVKRVWFSNGIHHHYSNNKILPEITEEYFKELIKNSDQKTFPVQKGENKDAFLKKIIPIIFDPNVAPKKVNLDANDDLVASSAVNFYEGVSQKEVEEFYKKMNIPGDSTPPSYGLNTKLVKEKGIIKEKVWKAGGMYSEAIEKIVYWLEKAVKVAENEKQRRALELLIEYYKSGDLKKFDEYCIAWVEDADSKIDMTHGFIEVYDDPLGKKGSYEAVVSVRDMETSKRIETIGKEAQWFEDHSPIMDEHKKKNVTGISAKVINVVAESGDASPSTAIGINLPNADWIRKQHGSKSVSLGNIIHAYSIMSKGSPILEEFAFSSDEVGLTKRYGGLSDNLHTDMHEVIGHASGRINEGVAPPHETLKNYASTLEEGRADLVALYYLLDEKLIQLGVMSSLDVGKAEYDNYIRNGLMVQLTRLQPGEQIEEAHMRNRQMVAGWTYEKGKKDNVIEKKVRDGKTFFVVNDYEKLRKLFGDLLREIQRIKSEGDYEAGKALVENYGVKVDQQLHKEILYRFTKLNIPPYKGFINPRLKPVRNQKDEIINVEIEYPFSFTDQMLEYAREHSFLPTYN